MQRAESGDTTTVPVPDHSVLARALKPEEAQHFTDTARRIGGILALVSE